MLQIETEADLASCSVRKYQTYESQYRQHVSLRHANDLNNYWMDCCDFSHVIHDPQRVDPTDSDDFFFTDVHGSQRIYPDDGGDPLHHCELHIYSFE